MERLLETYYALAPLGIRSFLKAMPVWSKEKLFLRKIIQGELSDLESPGEHKIPLLFPEHHLSHAASAFYPSPFQEAAVLTIDGVGEWATASLGFGRSQDLQILKELRFPHSVGLLYSAFTYYLGFRVNSGEYKLMGLAPYGDRKSSQTKGFRNKILTEMIDLKEDGSLWLNQKFFQYTWGLKMTNDREWKNLFGLEPRRSESELEPSHCNLALAIQMVTEEIVLKMALEARRLSGSKQLVMAGGVALNCVANGRLLREGIFDQIWIQPAAGDAGGALGAAYAAHYLYFNRERMITPSKDKMQGSLLGPQSTELEIRSMARSYQAVFKEFSSFPDLCDVVADLLDQGHIIGWHQGRMEFGPRALGNRSILGDARNQKMQKILNLKVKFRESFRPFAPAVLEEDQQNYFESKTHSPYMLLVANIKESLRKPVGEDFHQLPMRDKLYTQRSVLPAITHLDYSARVQTVNGKTNPRFHQLLKTFAAKTGCGVLVNTSFNVRGEPPVCTPEDSYRCFMRTGIDYLVIENTLFAKDQQPKWDEEEHWKEEFVLD